MQKYVLVADYCIENRLILRAYLLTKGYSVITARNSVDMLSKLIYYNPCLVITDIRIPKAECNNLIETLRTKVLFDQMHIILMSSEIEDINSPIAKELSAYEFLEKPINLNHLEDMVKCATQTKKLQENGYLQRNFPFLIEDEQFDIKQRFAVMWRKTNLVY